MYGDFSRLTYTPAKHYSAVWAQQGRVQLDADLNEQTAIVVDYLRTLAIDLIGPFGGHVVHGGFAVSVASKPRAHLELGPGHYYVYGMRCEASADGRPHVVRGVDPPDVPFIVDLLVWEQTVSAVQDPSLLEPALGLGMPDTTRRTQVRWKPRLRRRIPGRPGDVTGEEEPSDVRDAYVEHNEKPRVVPLLRARAAGPPGAAEDPSTIPAGSAYRGVENQLYRVEVHTPGPAGTATFKWSRDNGSVELPLESISEPDAEGRIAAQLLEVGRDRREALQPGDWVEPLDDDWAPAGRPGSLLRVSRVDEAAGRVDLTGETRDNELDARRHPFLRRWDQRPRMPADDNAITLVESDADAANDWIDLEDGVQVQFPAVGAHYDRGDFWLLPARVATGGVLWPVTDEGPVALPPHGPQRYLAPLAIVHSVEPVKIADLRVTFIGLAVDLISGGGGPDGSAEPAPGEGPNG